MKSLSTLMGKHALRTLAPSPERGGLALILAGPTAYTTASRGYSALVVPTREQSCSNLRSTPSALSPWLIPGQTMSREALQLKHHMTQSTCFGCSQQRLHGQKIAWWGLSCWRQVHKGRLL